MNKKKLSHSNLNSSITSVLAALLCIVIGMAVGFLVLLAINPAHAWGDGFVRIIKGGFHDAPYGVGKELANAAPLIMTGLSVAFAFKTGLFNIGAAGQYTLGAYGALYCAIMLKMPWYVCLIVATILGGIWGAIPGFFKAYFNINEVITSIMFNWIGLYLVNELIYQNGTGPMYDVRNTRTLNLSKNPAFAYCDARCWLAYRDGEVVGRIGAILSAFAGAEMMALNLPFESVFLILGIPAALTVAGLAAKGIFAAGHPPVASTSPASVRGAS